MARRFFTKQQDIDFESAVLPVQRQVDILDDVTHDVIPNEDGTVLHVFTDPSLVLNDVSFAARLSPQAMQIFIDRMNASQRSADALSALRSKLSDEQIMSTIKSKYIQKPSELIAYMQSLDDDWNIAAQKVLDEINARSATDDKPASSEPTNEPI